VQQIFRLHCSPDGVLHKLVVKLNSFAIGFRNKSAMWRKLQLCAHYPNKDPEQRQPHRPYATLIEPNRPLFLAGKNNAVLLSTGLDDSATGRAAAAYEAESEKWEGLIEAIAQNVGLSREQRAASISALRKRQQAAASGVQQKVMEEEKQKAKAFRRYQQQKAGFGS
jgi:hypothetical protein